MAQPCGLQTMLHLQTLFFISSYSSFRHISPS
nr:MAG TPA: hypothetical protein [Caudoviricetes sp.]